jgi:hypothetical protein
VIVSNPLQSIETLARLICQQKGAFPKPLREPQHVEQGIVTEEVYGCGTDILPATLISSLFPSDFLVRYLSVHSGPQLPFVPEMRGSLFFQQQFSDQREADQRNPSDSSYAAAAPGRSVSSVVIPNQDFALTTTMKRRTAQQK